MTATSGKLSTSTVSIKKLMNPDGTGTMNTHVDISNMPRNDYSMDELKMAWRQFAFQKQNTEKTFYNALIKREPIPVAGTTYRLEVDNQVQIDYISPILSELIDSLRHSLKNYEIEVVLELTSSPDEEVKYQNGKDKFATLARKNPNLHTLKNTFNLDIEF